MNRILIFVVAVIIVIGCFVLWKRSTAGTTFGGGEVTTRDNGADQTKHDTSANIDGPGEEVHPTPSRSDAPGTINTEPTGGATNNQPGAAQYPPARNIEPQATPVAGTGTMPPAYDTVNPNPPERVGFGGTGKFMWYRQGNLTWRVNSATGVACIAFATMEEWEKAIVYSHGCGNS